MKHVVQFFHFNTRWRRVYGLGFAFADCGGTLMSDDLKWAARAVEWKLYLGPLLLQWRLPYRVWRDTGWPNCCEGGCCASGKHCATKGYGS